MEGYLIAKKYLLGKRQLILILTMITLLTYNTEQTSSHLSENEFPYQTQIKNFHVNFETIQDNSMRGLNISDTHDIFLQIRKDGKLLASNSAKFIIWSLDLGSPLITSHIDIQNNSIDDIKLIPGMDGFIYHTDLKLNVMEKIDVRVENLIDKSPFTLPMWLDTIFLGDKISTVYTIDSENGQVVSKITSDYLPSSSFKEDTHSNLVTIVRTDFIIRCYNHIVEDAGLIWNMTVSEVSAIRDGVKILSEDKEEQISSQGRRVKFAHIENLYTNSNRNFILAQNISKTSIHNLHDIHDFPSQEKKLIDHINGQYLNIYTILIFILVCTCSVAIYFYSQIYKKNLELKKQIQLLKKESIDNISAKSTNTKFSNENSISGNFNHDDGTKKNSRMKKDFSRKNKIFPKIKNNFEEDYDCSEENLTDNELDNYEENFEENESDNEENFNSILFDKNNSQINKNRKTSITLFEEKSLNSIRSQNSKISNTSRISKIKSEKIYSEEEFKQKSKLPILSENFPLNYQKSDVSSVAECLIEEDDEKITKTEVRKLVTIYSKNSSNKIIEKNEFKNSSYRINVNAKLTKENFQIALETEKSNEDSNKTQNLCEESLDNLSQNNNYSNINNLNIPTNQIIQLNFEDKIFNGTENISRQISQEMDYENSSGKKEVFLNSMLKEKYQIELSLLQEMYVTDTLQKYSTILNNRSNSDKESQFKKILDELSENESDEENSQDENFKSMNLKSFNDEYYFNNFDTGRFLRNFEEIRIIGKGGFGCVFKSRHKIDSSEYAVKIIKLKIKMNEVLSELEVVKEIKTMMKLESKYVVRYVTCWFEMSSGKFRNYQQEKKIRSKSSNYCVRLRSNHNNNIIYTEDNTNKSKEISKNIYTKKNSNLNKEQIDSVSVSRSDCYIEEYFDSNRYKNSDIQFVHNNSNKNNNFISDENQNEAERDKSHSPTKYTRKNECSLNFPKTKSESEMFSVYFFMQIEYCNGFPLSFYLENRKKNTERNLVYSIFKQILLGVIHIHEHNIIHRDLKPANILIHDNFCVKIGDFGLATDRNKNTPNEIELKENVGTPLYQSPEQVQGKPYNEKVDIYSLGIILLELCTLFKTQSERRAVLEKVRAVGEIPEKIILNYPIEYNLIRMMVNTLPLNRPSAKEILNSCELKKLMSKFELEETSFGDINN